MSLTRAHRLPYTPPLDAAALLDHFTVRAVPGLEAVQAGTYTRSLSLPHGAAVLVVDLSGACDALPAELSLADAADEPAALALCRGLFDLDANPAAVSAALGGDPLLGATVRAAPGRRVPGAAGASELAVRAVLGQQISLAGAATAAGRLVTRCGEPLGELARGTVTHRFPSAAALAALDPETLPMPRARARSLVTLAAAFAAGELPLQRGGDPAAARATLLALPGIGPWTADYVVMRVLGDHDVFLASDLGVRRALQRAGLPGDPASAGALAERWSPYRSYAMQYLWGPPVSGPR
jgi:AraC family transcriptional regulator of adaptative response / DNA-3-methyladenine glycosylase II